jgi:hypothetical protein
VLDLLEALLGLPPVAVGVESSASRADAASDPPSAGPEPTIEPEIEPAVFLSDTRGSTSPSRGLVPNEEAETTRPPDMLLTATSGSRSYDVKRFVDYALKWTRSNTMNPNYPNFKDNNCANFASQALDTTWPQTGGVNPRDLDNWDPDLSGPKGATYTWVGARYLYRYAYDSKRLNWMRNIWDAQPSDMYFLDWDNDGDSVIDHVAVVTGRTSSGVPRISQKTTNRYNVLLTTWREIIADSTGPDPIWYGLVNRVR